MNHCDLWLHPRDTKATPADCHSTDEIFDALELIIGDVHRFLQNFCERLQHVPAPRQSDNDHSSEADSLAQEREQWEAKRARVEHKIREQLDLLAAAWLRLEAEQRSFLQMKEGLAFDVSNRPEKKPLQASLETGLQTVPGGAKPPPLLPQSAIREFERLRQEIQSSRPHNHAERD